MTSAGHRALETLRGEFDALVERMQSTEAAAAGQALFEASPHQLGQAAQSAATGAASTSRYTRTMTVALLTEIPLTLPAEPGPYRRRDYEDLPDESRCELIYGRLYASPSPNPRHQVVVAAIWSILHRIAGASGGIAFVAPLDVVLADHSVVQPDVIYIAAGNRGIIAERLEGTPDLVVEVVSPGTSRRDRGEKLALYAESGIKEYWIVDPGERQVEFLVNEAGRFVVALPAGAEYRSRALPEIRLDLLALWREVDETLG